MTGGRIGAGRDDVLRLFGGDSVAGLGEGELLDRFATRRDEAAFGALVARLGPMVLGVCRRMLADPHDVDDAFQATFLVLVRKAGAIRDRDLVAPWLHGVALKVSRRARADALRRAARERSAGVPEAVEGVDPGRPELRALIDEEIGRLPEGHRRAVVLCDVEGLTREEAALRLGWSLNMVRGRLERARGRLRDRLARRGVAPAGAWAALGVAPSAPPPALMAATIRMALAFSSGRMAAGLASASAVALSQGVLRMMMLSKLKVGLVVLLSAGFVAGGSGLIAARRPGENPKASLAKPDPPPVGPDVKVPSQPRPAADLAKARSAADLAKARVEAARKRYEAQKAFYDEGRITIDRLVDASRGLMQAEVNTAGSKAARVAAARSHYDRLDAILRREQAELEVGRATAADLAEAKTGLLDAEFDLAKETEAPEAKEAEGAQASPPESASFRQALIDYQRSRRQMLDSLDFLRREMSGRAEARRKAGMPDAAEAMDSLVSRIENLRTALDQPLGTFPDPDPRDPVDAKPAGAEDKAGAGPIPGPSKARKDERPSTLADAVAAFNEDAKGLEIGRDQPPLTADEVVGAIRYYEAETGPSLIKGAIDEFLVVAETREMPPGMRLESFESKDLGGNLAFEGWWVRITSGDGRATLPIRSSVNRSMTLEEARDSAYAKQLRAGNSPKLEDRRALHHLGESMKSLERRIEQRNKGIKPF